MREERRSERLVAEMSGRRRLRGAALDRDLREWLADTVPATFAQP
jgi:hypothetical protein